MIVTFEFLFFFPDPRVKGWFLLQNYTPTFIFSVLYLLIVWLGPKYMQNRQPFSCRGILVIYNLGLTLLSLYMFYEVRKKWRSIFERLVTSGLALTRCCDFSVLKCRVVQFLWSCSNNAFWDNLGSVCKAAGTSPSSRALFSYDSIATGMKRHNISEAESMKRLE